MDRDSKLTAEEPVDSSRRDLLGFLTAVLGAAPVIGGLFLMVRAGLAPTKDNRPERFLLCKKSELPAEGSTEIKEFVISYQCRQGAKVESIAKVVFVTRDPASGQCLAMAGECTHLSCPVQKRELTMQSGGKAPLTCPCHGGMFSQVGEVLDGPPKLPLRRLKLGGMPADDDGDVYLLEV